MNWSIDDVRKKINQQFNLTFLYCTLSFLRRRDYAIIPSHKLFEWVHHINHTSYKFRATWCDWWDKTISPWSWFNRFLFTIQSYWNQWIVLTLFKISKVFLMNIMKVVLVYQILRWTEKRFFYYVNSVLILTSKYSIISTFLLEIL